MLRRIGRSSPSVSALEDDRVHVQVPLFADATMTDTDVIQTSSHRFHGWLLYITDIVQENRIGELME